MAGRQFGNVTASDACGRPPIEPFLAESGAGYEVPSVEPGLRPFGSGRNAPPPRFALVTPWNWAPSGGPNALSSGEARPFDAYGRFHLPESRRLADALAELAEVDDEIAEDDLPQVSDTTKAEAERLVRALAQRAPASVLLAVYPTQDAGIALHFKAPDRPGAILVLLRDDGQADCHAYIGGRSRRAHYGTSSDLPDAFVLDQLRRLAPTLDGVSTPGAGFSPFWMAVPSTNLLLTS